MGSENEEVIRGRSDADLLNKSTTGASFLMLTQLFTKMLTFLLNQLLIRLISPRVFGISAYLEFIVSMVLFFSREGERLSIQRTRDISSENDNGTKRRTDKYVEGTPVGTLQSIINFGYIPLVVGGPLSIAILVWQYHSLNFQESLLTLPYYRVTVLLVWLLMMLELVAEPLYAISQFQLNFRKRSKYESVGVFGRCIITFAVIAIVQRTSRASNLEYDGLAVVAFAAGQFGYSLLIFFQYQLSFARENQIKLPEEQNSLLIRKISTQLEDSYYYFDTKIFAIWRSLFILMIFKHFLTEGDKLLINYLCTVEQQGTYAVVCNYGSIIARLVFQPIEESLRLLFTRMLSTKSKENIRKSYDIMQYLGIFYLNLSLLIGIAGYSNAAYFLLILLGGKAPKWANTGIFDIFPQYIVYIPFLAFNGILEAFFNSVADGSDIRRFSIFMSFLTIIVLCSLYAFITHFELGLSGLILANALNMALRIGYCSIYIKSFYSKNGLEIAYTNVLKRIGGSLVMFIIVAYCQYVTLDNNIKSSSITDVIKSACICLIYLMFMIYSDRNILKDPFLDFKKRLLAKKKPSKQD